MASTRPKPSGGEKTLPPEKKKMVLFRLYIGFGGIERQIASLIGRLTEQGWQITFVSDTPSPLSEAAGQAGAEVLFLQKKKMFGRALELRRICRQKNAAVLQAHMFYESILCRLVRALSPRLRCVFRVHTYIDCAQIAKLKKNLYHLLAWLTAPWVDRYISINEYNVREMRARTHLSGKKIRVVPNALRAAVADFEAGEEYCAAAEPDRMAMVANFVDFKGHDTLLEGMKLLKDRGCEVKVRLVGGVHGQGTDHEDTRRLEIVKNTVREYGLEDRVELYGVSKDIPAVVKDCSMVVLPSDSEGTPNVLLEGMWLKKLVIASAVGGVPEFVTDGVTGFLHPPKDPAAFADAVIRAMETPAPERETILANARRVVEERYLMPAVMQKLADIYLELLGE